MKSVQHDARKQQSDSHNKFNQYKSKSNNLQPSIQRQVPQQNCLKNSQQLEELLQTDLNQSQKYFQNEVMVPILNNLNKENCEQQQNELKQLIDIVQSQDFQKQSIAIPEKNILCDDLQITQKSPSLLLPTIITNTGNLSCIHDINIQQQAKDQDELPKSVQQSQTYEQLNPSLLIKPQQSGVELLQFQLNNISQQLNNYSSCMTKSKRVEIIQKIKLQQSAIFHQEKEVQVTQSQIDQLSGKLHKAKKDIKTVQLLNAKKTKQLKEMTTMTSKLEQLNVDLKLIVQNQEQKLEDQSQLAEQREIVQENTLLKKIDAKKSDLITKMTGLHLLNQKQAIFHKIDFLKNKQEMLSAQLSTNQKQLVSPNLVVINNDEGVQRVDNIVKFLQQQDIQASISDKHGNNADQQPNLLKESKLSNISLSQCKQDEEYNTIPNSIDINNYYRVPQQKDDTQEQIENYTPQIIEQHAQLVKIVQENQNNMNHNHNEDITSDSTDSPDTDNIAIVQCVESCSADKREESEVKMHVLDSKRHKTLMESEIIPDVHEVKILNQQLIKFQPSPMCKITRKSVSQPNQLKTNPMNVLLQTVQKNAEDQLTQQQNALFNFQTQQQVDDLKQGFSLLKPHSVDVKHISEIIQPPKASEATQTKKSSQNRLIDQISMLEDKQDNTQASLVLSNQHYQMRVEKLQEVNYNSLELLQEMNRKYVALQIEAAAQREENNRLKLELDYLRSQSMLNNSTLL